MPISVKLEFNPAFVNNVMPLFMQNLHRFLSWAQNASYSQVTEMVSEPRSKVDFHYMSKHVLSNKPNVTFSDFEGHHTPDAFICDPPTFAFRYNDVGILTFVKLNPVNCEGVGVTLNFNA